MSSDSPETPSPTRRAVASPAAARVRRAATAEPFQPVQTIVLTASLERDRRRTQAVRLLSSILLIVVLPTLVAAAYMGFFATPRYVSEAAITIHTPQEAASTSIVDSILLGGGGGGSQTGHVVAQYIVSAEILARLDRKLDVRGHYSQPEADYFSRLDPEASREDFLDYYRSRVSTIYDPVQGFIQVEVEAFDPAFAQTLATAILSFSEELVNAMTARAREDAVGFAQKEVARAEERLRGARMALTDFRNTHGDLDPASAAGAILQIVGGLEGQLAAANAELNQMRVFMRENNDKVVALRAKIRSLEHQIEAEKTRLAGEGDVPKVYSETLSAYQALLLEEEFAKSGYMAASSGLEIARAEASRKHNYIFGFQPPTLPDQATRPETLLGTARVFSVAFLIFLVLALLRGSLRDQVGV